MSLRHWFKTSIVLAALALAACGEDEKDSSGPTITPGNNTQTNSSNASNNTNATNNTNSTNGTNNTNSANGTNNTNSTNNANSTNNTNNTQPTCNGIDPPIGPCDPLCQTGCDEGQACGTNAPAGEDEALVAACVTPGSAAQGDACDSNEDCALGFICASSAGEPTTCMQLCRPGSTVDPQCAQDFECQVYGSSIEIGICIVPSEECTVFPDSCGDTQDCYKTDQGYQCADYNPEAGYDTACTVSTDCGEDYRCVSVPDTGKVCRPLCNLDDIDPCGGGTACTEVKDDEGVAFVWGACL